MKKLAIAAAWCLPVAFGVPLARAEQICEAQTFNAGSTWELCVEAVDAFGLVISSVSFKKSPSSPAVRVLHDGRLGEIFVPYHEGEPRFGDVSIGFPSLTLSSADCPAPHVLMGSDEICKELRDSGVSWKDDALVRRGQEVAYWAVLDASNYNYLMEWRFRDDGSILVRSGSTGPKHGGPDDTRGHMHSFTWRLDMDLNGPAGDSVYYTKHVENLSVDPSTAQDSSILIPKEGSRLWNAAQFNTLEIGDSALVNSNGRSTLYELIPFRRGTARHTEAFTKKDFWVTRFGDEFFAQDLPAYVANAQSTAGQDIVVWYTGSCHHEDGMRDEDRDTVPVIWVEFELVPKNLFDATPFFS